MKEGEPQASTDAPARPVAVQLQITVTTPRTQVAEAVFEHFDAQAISELDAGSALTVEMTPHTHPAFEQARVVGMFREDAPAEPIIALLREALGSDVPIDTQMLENQDWTSAWLAQHPPLQFGTRLWIAPHGAPVEVSDDAIVVRLDPGLAFGTGTHPTTALCLDWLSVQPLAGKRVLDYGCGSGILAVAAACLGASSITAVDIDPQATRATAENAQRNGVAERIQTPPMDGLGDARFDIVLANILAKPLIELAPVLARHAEDRAPIVLSGLLTRQIDDVVAAYQSQFDFDQPTVDQDWVRLVACRYPRG